jgi:hypothetical protein
MMTAVTPPRHTKSGGMSRLGNRANGRRYAHRPVMIGTDVIGASLASPDHDGSMIKSRMTIVSSRLVAALD